jgi:peptidoglycan/xylan/chitin deacetylase (PgdA/CDA1 family)
MSFIKRIVREVLAAAIRWLGVAIFVRRCIAAGKATVVVYHDPTPETFAKHIKFLAKHYTFISLTRLIDAINKRDVSLIPRNALVLTIDDGHKGNYSLMETFRGYGVEPVIYLCSQIVNTHRRFWWKTGEFDVKPLKKLSHKDKLFWLEQEVGYHREEEHHERQALDLDEILSLTPLVHFGSHTQYHPILINCSDAQCRQEIVDAKEELEQLLSQSVVHFAYPNGDYSAREILLVRSAGYRSARTLDVGWNDISSDPYRLRAMCVEDDASINVLCAQISGVFPFLHYLLRGNHKGQRPAAI